MVGAYLASFAVIYFNVALAAAADQALRGQQPDLKAAGQVARSRIGVIAAWAAVSAVVSAFFALLRDKGGVVGNIGAGIGAAIWGLITFMVIPVLAFEGIGPFGAIKRSASLFRQRWGQQVTGNVVIGGVAGLVVLLGVLAGVGGVALLARRRGRPGGARRRPAAGRCGGRHRRFRVRRRHPGRVRHRALPLHRRGPGRRPVRARPSWSSAVRSR